MSTRDVASKRRRLRPAAPPASAGVAWKRRPSRVAALLVPLVAVLASGCIDFLDPKLPPAGPAILQLFIHMNGAQVQVEAQLQPGMSLAHEWRTIPNDSLLVGTQPVAPKTVHANGARDYSATVPLPSPVGPVLIEPPAVDGIPGRPPEIKWYGVRRLDPDTVVLPAGADLRLHIDPTLPPQTPAPSIAQWYLTLVGGGHQFQLGADGLPPAELRVPAEFLPGDSTSTLSASLLVLHGGIANEPGGNYVLNASFDQHVVWTVIRPTKGTTP